MFRILLIVFVFVCSMASSTAQQPVAIPANPIPDANCVSVDQMSSYLKEHYPSDTARIRAIYDWITTHINYDVGRFLARDKNPLAPPATAAEVLGSRQAVCQGYAELFVALCTATGIEAQIVGGYSKLMGKVSETGHAWVAANLGGEWYFFDPTWGAGFVRNEVFVKRYNDRFYKVAPIRFIDEHMPSDPMFQLLSYPLTHQEFAAGRPAASRALFSYKDTLRLYNQLPRLAQNAAELRRIRAAGVSNKLLQEREAYLSRNLNAAASKDVFYEAQDNYKYSFSLYKVFMDLKRTQFANEPDADLRARMDSIEFYLKKSRSLLLQVDPRTDAQRASKANVTASMDKFWTEVVKQKDFMLKYLATDKEKRKLLFMR